MNHIQKFIRNRKVIIPILAISILFAVYFGTRGIFLVKAVSSVNNKLAGYNYTSHWDGARFKGLNKIFVREIYVQSKNGNSEVQVDSILVRIKLFPLITGNVRISRLNCKSLRVRYDSNDSLKIPVPEKTDSSDFFDRLKKKDLAYFAYRHIRRIINYVPSRVHVGRIEIRYTFAFNTSVLLLQQASLKKGRFSAKLTAGEKQVVVNMPVSGSFDRSRSVIGIHVSNADTGMLPLPVLVDRFGINAGFDSLDFLINLGQRNRHLVNIDGQMNLIGFEVNGERLSTGNIIINRFSSNYHMHIGPDYVEMDSSSRVHLNSIEFNPYIKLNLKEAPVIDLRILRQNWNANDFFGSLPQGMFTSLTGTTATGYMEFYMNFTVNLEMPDSLKFDINLKGRDFNIISFGLDDYRMLNRTFIHKVYSRGNLVASFPVGPENPEFMPFESISPFVRAAVMTSEDGSFFYHNGFNPGAFRESIATNIKEQRFARGGSTISMQLVKNVFLTRNKTIARKIEEALIVWLIENLNLVSKQRMYEVYLNIIEWGPGVYGIGQASQYYFSKKPSDLTLQDGIFLASIVPRPRWFKYTFEANGRPKHFFAVYFNRLKELMVRKEFIAPSDTVGIIPVVTLSGPATQLFDTAYFRGAEQLIPPLEPLTIRKIQDLK